MLIQLEADFPNPLVKALQAALSAHPDGPVTVEKAISDDAPVQDTVVFMINRDKRRIAPAIQLRAQQGYRVFALRQPSGNVYDPFWLTMRVLGLLWQIVDILEADKESFVYSLQPGSRKRQLVRSELPHISPVSALPNKSKPKKKRPPALLPEATNVIPLFHNSLQ